MRSQSDVSPEWEQFRNFERWLLEAGFRPGDRLLRIDTSSPWGPGNARVQSR